MEVICCFMSFTVGARWGPFLWGSPNVSSSGSFLGAIPLLQRRIHPPPPWGGVDGEGWAVQIQSPLSLEMCGAGDPVYNHLHLDFHLILLVSLWHLSLLFLLIGLRPSISPLNKPPQGEGDHLAVLSGGGNLRHLPTHPPVSSWADPAQLQFYNSSLSFAVPSACEPCVLPRSHSLIWLCSH